MTLPRPSCLGGTAARLSISVAFLLGLTGCFEIHEELWVRDNGTVRYALDYAVPELILAMPDSGRADSAFASLKHPPREVVEGDSVWSREYVDGDLHHFRSERELASFDRFVGLSAREDAREDSAARYSEAKTREYARRDSILRVSRGPGGRATRDSIMHVMAQPDTTPHPSFHEGEVAVLGGYESRPAGTGLLRLRHVFRSKGMFGLSPRDRSAQRQFAGRTYGYRLHAPQIVSSNGTKSPDGSTVEWSIPMSALGDSAMAMEAVIRVKK
jgi:hypothetical protein